MIEQRERHCTVAQLRDVLANLRDDDVICTELPPTGNIPVLRDDAQIGVIELAPQDLGVPVPPDARLDLFK